MRRSILVWALLLSFGSGVARADRFAALDKAARDSSWRVRLQAATILSKIDDPRSISLLERLLGDEQVAVRRAASAALNRLRAAAPPLPGKKDVEVRIGGVGCKARNTRPEMKNELRTLLQQEFAHTPSARLNGQQITGYLIDGSIVTFDRRMTRDWVEVTVEISVIVGRLPSKAMVMMTSGGATVQEPKSNVSPARAAALETDALEGAVKGAHENLLAYLKTH